MIFVAIVLAIVALTHKFTPKLPALALKPVIYAIGIIASFWCVERIAGFWG